MPDRSPQDQLTSTVNITGGTLHVASGAGAGVVNISGGQIGRVWVRDDATANITGGHIEQMLTITRDGTINIHGQPDLELSPSESNTPSRQHYRLTGTLLDETKLGDGIFVRLINPEAAQVNLIHHDPPNDE